ncbi:MAG: hypothetical protein KGR24_10460 [Planctomycetes bacterium]|nr:hypothetical protein [Planctomycetota bacterium]
MSDIVAEAKAWLEWRPPHRSSQDGRTHSDDCHRVHVDCLIERLVAELERHRMTEVEREAANCCAVRLSGLCIGGVLMAYLDRTAPLAAS